jgi:hypothetical protein
MEKGLLIRLISMTQMWRMTELILDVLAVNQENGDRCPVNYIIPPGVQENNCI